MSSSVLCLCSAKGGVAKTTLSVNIAYEAAMRDIPSIILDGDNNQHASKFGSMFNRIWPDTPIRVIRGVNQDNLRAKLREAKAEAQLVVIDLPAGTSALSMTAMMSSNMVLVPSGRTTLEARDAIRTAIQVTDVIEMAERPLPSALIWTKVSARFASNTEILVQDAVRENLLEPDKAILKNVLLETEAFRAGFQHGFVPRKMLEFAGKKIEWPPGSGDMVTITKSVTKAAQNMHEIADEILGRLTDVMNGLNPGMLSLAPEVIAAFKEQQSQESAEGVR